MKKRQIIFAVIILLIGVVIGMLTSAQLRLTRLKPVRMYFSEERFREGFYRTIQPDEEQKAKIELILDKYAKINSETQSRFRKEFDSNVKAMRKELDSNLTKEQLARLKEMDEKRQEMMKQERIEKGKRYLPVPQRQALSRQEAGRWSSSAISRDPGQRRLSYRKQQVVKQYWKILRINSKREQKRPVFFKNIHEFFFGNLTAVDTKPV